MWRSFFLPLSLTLLMHGIALALVIFGLPSASDELLARPLPKFVNAELVVIEKPKPKPAPKKLPPKPEPEPKPIPKSEKKPEPKPKAAAKPKPQPDPNAAKRKAEIARKEREQLQQKQQEALRRQEQQQQQRQQQERELLEALSEDDELLTAQEDRQTASTYEGKIQQAIMLAWSRPPSARNGMVVRLRIRLIPTGEVIDVQVIESSGDAAFDRSALRAVQKVGGFPELKNLEYRVFKRYFETFEIKFRPEDLRR